MLIGWHLLALWCGGLNKKSEVDVVGVGKDFWRAAFTLELQELDITEQQAEVEEEFFSEKKANWQKLKSFIRYIKVAYNISAKFCVISAID